MSEEKASTGIAVARITAVLGMALTMAGGIALLAFVPFFFLMRYLEGRQPDKG